MQYVVTLRQAVWAKIFSCEFYKEKKSDFLSSEKSLAVSRNFEISQNISSQSDKVLCTKNISFRDECPHFKFGHSLLVQTCDYMMI